MLVKGYPKSTKEEYPSLPFDRIDGAFAVSSTVFLFKGFYHYLIHHKPQSVFLTNQYQIQ